MKNSKTLIFIMFILALLSCGFIFDEPMVIMDPEEHISYMYVDPVELSKSANGHYCMYGIVKEVNKSSQTALITDSEGRVRISCKSRKRKIGGEIAINDTVRVYGNLSSSALGKDFILDINKIERSQVTYWSGTVYSSENGTTLTPDDSNEREIAGGKIRFNIPESWEAAEYDIRENDLGCLDGYQYRLNNIGKRNAYAESFFIAYFDKKKMVDINDSRENTFIEKAIVRDIMKKENLTGRFPLKEVASSYGPRYKFYRSKFTKATGEGYWTEFAFREEGDGIVVFLYVYNDKTDHIEDIMNVLRTVKVS